ncbi:MAG: hypothetical protein JXB29_01380 [Sedimentisphaerales bacterium]|nr:hypothetical protein [Sedimentisphaerales bacterium]
MKKRCLIVVGLALIIVTAMSVVFAAEEDPQPRPSRENTAAGQQDRPRRGDRTQRGGFQQRMVEMVKSELGATDKEWTVIEPRLTKVMTLSRDVSQRGMGMMRRGRRGDDTGGRGGRGRQGQPTQESQSEQSEVQKATNSLQEVLDKSDASPDEVKAKLLALRNAKEKTKQELAKAQQDLKQILSIRQEAKLVLLGLLD